MLGRDRRNVGDDAATRLDRDREQAGEIAFAGDEIDDLLAVVDVREFEHRRGLAVAVARDVGGRAVLVGDRHLGVRADGSAPDEQGGKQTGGRTAHRNSPQCVPLHYASGAGVRSPYSVGGRLWSKRASASACKSPFARWTSEMPSIVTASGRSSRAWSE